MAISATKNNVRSLMNWLDALVTLVTADTLGIGFSLGLVDPISRRTRIRLGNGEIRRKGSWRAVARGCFSALPIHAGPEDEDEGEDE